MCNSSGPGSGNQRLIGSQLLARARTWQQLQKHFKIGETRYHLFDSHHGDVRLWQTGSQPNVSFVFQNQNCAGFGDAKIDSADTKIRSREFVAQHLTSGAGKFGDVVCPLDPKPGGEEFGNLTFCLVNCRSDDVGRSFAGELNYVLAKIRLDSFDSLGLQSGVEMDLLGRHTLGLDDRTRIAPVRQFANNAIGFGRITRPMNLRSGSLRVRRKFLEILIEMQQRFVFDRSRLRSEFFPVGETSGGLEPAPAKQSRRILQGTA